MSRENVELALRTYDAVNRRDIDALLALMDDDVEVVTRIAPVEGGLRGHDGMRRWWENMFTAFPDYEFEVVDARDLQDVTLASLRAVGHGAGSAVPFEDLLWHASRWRRGKCIWWRAFETEAEALDAVRVSASQEVPDHFRWLYSGDPHDPQDYAARWNENAVVNQSPDVLDTAGRFEGWDGFVRMLDELESAASDLSFEPVRVIDLPEPDRHLVLIEFSAIGVGSGIPINGRLAHLVTLRDGRFSQMDVFAGWEQALEAVGLAK
jgi:ketosteroid isomerase-like protein